MKVYLTLHTDGNRNYHKQFYEMFNDEYRTKENGFIGNDNKWSETYGTNMYDLTKNKYVKLKELFIKVGFDKKDFYYSIGRPIKYVNGGEARNTKIYGTIETMKLQTYNNGHLNIHKNKYHYYEEYAISYIMFHKRPVYIEDNDDDFKPENEKVYMKDDANKEKELKLMEINKKLIEAQAKVIEQKRNYIEKFNKKHNINLIIKNCSKCGYTDEKGIFHSYKYYYDENEPHECTNSVYKNWF